MEFGGLIYVTVILVLDEIVMRGNVIKNREELLRL